MKTQPTELKPNHTSPLEDKWGRIVYDRYGRTNICKAISEIHRVMYGASYKLRIDSFLYDMF